jgi:hypothetical protein
MTTNTYDSKAKLGASDTRISAQEGDYFFFIDDSGYEKIVYDKNLMVMFAGDLPPIEAWKQWFKGGMAGDHPGTPGEISICTVELHDGNIGSDRGKSERSACGQARFAGTGAYYANRCWRQHEDALKSIVSASHGDLRTGGEVRYLKVSDLANNLADTTTLTQLMEALRTKGKMIMLGTSPKTEPVLISEAIAKDQAANDAFEKVMSAGAASLCAPFIGMGEPWTDEEKASLNAVLAKYAPKAVV